MGLTMYKRKVIGKNCYFNGEQCQIGMIVETKNENLFGKKAETVMKADQPIEVATPKRAPRKPRKTTAKTEA